MRAVNVGLCTASVSVTLLLSLLPWGGGEPVRIAILLLPVVAILCWVAMRPDGVSLALPFLGGIAVDAVTQGPLGVWAMSYLLAVGLGIPLFHNGSQRRRGAPAIWLRIALLAGVASFAVWALASLYDFAMRPAAPFALAALIAGSVVPAFMLVLFPLTRFGLEQRRLQLERPGMG